MTGIDLSRHQPQYIAQARAIWQERVSTEFRSAQLMNRFLGELLAVGDPRDEWAAVAELVSDELKHVALCSSVVRELGQNPQLPAAEPQSLEFERMPPVRRALSIGIALLVVNET